MNDLTGSVFGRLTVMEQAQNQNGRRAYVCKCACSKTKIIQAQNLIRGSTNSCGCLHHEIRLRQRPNPTTHGMSGNPMYAVWKMLRHRCTNPDNKSYKNYGGRGITFCSFIDSHPGNIEKILGERPNGMTVDRINNDGHYSCGSCEDCKNRGLTKNIQWATRKAQARNQRSNVLIVFMGQVRCLKEWCELFGHNYHKVYKRYEMGWPTHKLFT